MGKVVWCDTEKEMERALKAMARPIELTEAEYYAAVANTENWKRENYTYQKAVPRFRG